MKIVCKLQRPDGTKVEFGKTVYHFKADKNGEHVCEVTDKNHIQLLLNVPEAYAPQGQAEPEPVDTSAEDEAKDLFPLVALDVPALSNKELTTVASKHLGVIGTNKDLLATWAQKKLGLEGLATRNPKDSYIELLREVVLKVQEVQRAEKQAFLLESEPAEETDA